MASFEGSTRKKASGFARGKLRNNRNPRENSRNKRINTTKQGVFRPDRVYYNTGMAVLVGKFTGESPIEFARK